MTYLMSFIKQSECSIALKDVIPETADCYINSLLCQSEVTKKWCVFLRAGMAVWSHSFNFQNYDPVNLLLCSIPSNVSLYVQLKSPIVIFPLQAIFQCHSATVHALAYSRPLVLVGPTPL